MKLQLTFSITFVFFSLFLPQPKCKCVKVAGLTFTLHDTPGRKSFRDAWHESISTCAAEAIVFVVDSTDSMRLPIVQEVMRECDRRE